LAVLTVFNTVLYLKFSYGDLAQTVVTTKNGLLYKSIKHYLVEYCWTVNKQLTSSLQSAVTTGDTGTTSAKTKLTQNRPPFQAQHMKILWQTLGGLQQIINKYATYINHNVKTAIH